MTTLRLLADDLTGALDTTAEFVPLTGDVPVFWRPGDQLNGPASAALDSGTRECAPPAAMAQVGRAARTLAGAQIAFKKIDSLFRGPTISEIAACMQTGLWQYCTLAPAFPYQSRITRAGQQYARVDGDWVAFSEELTAALQSFGVAAQPGDVNADLKPGVSVFDAETDDDLQRVVSAVRRCPAPVLWAGTGGLAQAIAAGHPHPPIAPLARPVLGLFGSDQPATADQLAACEPHWLEVDDEALAPIPGRLTDTGLALVSFRLPAGTSRAKAQQRIAAAVGRLTETLVPPGTIVVAGGETLRSVCNAVGADSLLVQGRLLPGVAKSVIQGGRWNGVTVVSKSGAFGHPNLLRELLTAQFG